MSINRAAQSSARETKSTDSIALSANVTVILNEAGFLLAPRINRYTHTIIVQWTWSVISSTLPAVCGELDRVHCI